MHVYKIYKPRESAVTSACCLYPENSLCPIMFDKEKKRKTKPYASSLCFNKLRVPSEYKY